jgi:hypothetical protein
MSYLSNETPTKKVELPSDKKYWVEVKVGLKYGEIKNYIEYGGTEGHFTIGEKLRISVVAWNLDDAEGNILPITAESIDCLQEPDLIAVADVVLLEEADRVKKNSPKA